MTDYISREALGIGLCNPDVFEDKGYAKGWNAAIEIIQNAPAADVRPVVLCRDCQNSYEWANVDGDNYRYCGYLRSRWNHDADRMVDDDDFCKWGRKREESKCVTNMPKLVLSSLYGKCVANTDREEEASE